MLYTVTMSDIYNAVINSTCEYLKKETKLKNRACKKVKDISIAGVKLLVKSCKKVKDKFLMGVQTVEEFFRTDSIYPEMEEDFSLLSVDDLFDLFYEIN